VAHGGPIDQKEDRIKDFDITDPSGGTRSLRVLVELANDATEELIEALVHDRRDPQDLTAELLLEGVGTFGGLVALDLRGDDEPRSAGERAGVEGELGVDRCEGLARRLMGQLRTVHELHQGLGAFDMTQELMTEPFALARAADEAGISAITSSRKPGRSTMPSCGVSVVNG
jgi:hypothetical protein